MTELSKTSLKNSFGQWQLHRWPPVDDPSLQAWDAADELLLSHIADIAERRKQPFSSVLLLNDAHGALATCLHEYAPVSWSDSYLAHCAAQENLSANQLTSSLMALKSTETPSGVFDLVLIRIPKTTALLEDQLARLRPCVTSNTVIVATAMVKHLQKSAFRCLERYMGAVSTSLAVKKARLLFVELDESLPFQVSPYPDEFTDTETGLTLLNHANVFSRSHLDHGARFLMSHYADLSPAERAIDLGCGNGVLGIKLQEIMPTASVQYIDESYSAVASAQANHGRHFAKQPREAEFVVADGLQLRASDSADLILCNPPFHQQHVLGDQIARTMFADSHRCLVQGGEIRVVGNRHLDHARTLKRLFGNCQMVASNSKFAIMRSVRR